MEKHTQVLLYHFLFMETIVFVPKKKNLLAKKGISELINVDLTGKEPVGLSGCCL
jgi:hypothetical protein